jgi:hypothetical protein
VPSDSSEVDAAVIAKLLGDTTLMALMPDGIYVDVAKSGLTKFIIVSQLAHEDVYMFQGSAYEAFEYLVKAVTGPSGTDLNTSGGSIKAAAARIHTVLQDATLTITGYKLMNIARAERIRYTEVDADNEDARWHHRGGRYAVMVSP